MTVRVRGLESLIQRLSGLEGSIKERQRTLMERLAKIGIDVAAMRFSTAQYDGVNDVIVRREPEWISDNTLRIHADGSTVAFIEFGTGVHYREQHPKAAELHMIRGTYGYGLGRFDSWKYKGAPGTNGEMTDSDYVWTHGNPPARAMYEAGREIRDRIREVAREVFNGD